MHQHPGIEMNTHTGSRDAIYFRLDELRAAAAI
jgi:hypothetical protein